MERRVARLAMQLNLRLAKSAWADKFKCLSDHYRRLMSNERLFILVDWPRADTLRLVSSCLLGSQKLSEEQRLASGDVVVAHVGHDRWTDRKPRIFVLTSTNTQSFDLSGSLRKVSAIRATEGGSRPLSLTSYVLNLPLTQKQSGRKSLSTRVLARTQQTECIIRNTDYTHASSLRDGHLLSGGSQSCEPR